MPVALIELAWILAKADRADLRNAIAAVRLAERAADLTQRQDPSVLDALEAAYLAANQMDRAAETAEAARALRQRK